MLFVLPSGDQEPLGCSTAVLRIGQSLPHPDQSACLLEILAALSGRLHALADPSCSILATIQGPARVL